MGNQSCTNPTRQSSLHFGLITKPFRRKPAAVPAILAVLAGMATACAGPSLEPKPVQLRFPGTEQTASGCDGYRLVARSAARAYVKVVIISNASAVRERGYGQAPRIVSGASGIIVDPSGYVVTAAHIARNTALEARVTTIDGHIHSARIVHVAADRELALLKISGAGSRLFAAEPAAGVRRGQPVFAVGTPGNRPGAVAFGHVVQPRLDRRIGYDGFGFYSPMELSLRVDPGHSGGPVFDAEGALLGMIVAFDLRSSAPGEYTNTGVAYAIPAREVMRYFRRWTPRTGNIGPPICVPILTMVAQADPAIPPAVSTAGQCGSARHAITMNDSSQPCVTERGD